MAGSRPTGQAILLDDENLQNFWSKGMGSVMGTSLGIEAIGEFQTLTNTYSAQFGGNGAVVNAVSRTGTNTVHGSAYEFFRNDVLDARGFFDPHTIPTYRQNQFGGTVGGPIRARAKSLSFPVVTSPSSPRTAFLPPAPRPPRPQRSAIPWPFSPPRIWWWADSLKP